MKFPVFFFVLLFSFSFVSAQWIIDEDFVPVSSEECGDRDNACMHATMTGLLVSLNDSRIGTNVTLVKDRIHGGLLGHGADHPYPTRIVVNAAIKFLLTVL